MATPLPAATAVRSTFSCKPNPSASLFSASDTFYKRQCHCLVTTSRVSSLRSSASYGSLQGFAIRIPGSKMRLQKSRDRFVRCATKEEIEAEKKTIEKDVRERMEKTIETLKTNFNSIRTGRSNPAMLDKVEVDYYGSPVSLKSMAQISTPDGSSLLIQPYDKSSLKAIEKAIVSSDVGITPNNDGDVIRLSIPQLTSDRRKELSKIVSKQAEEGKVNTVHTPLHDATEVFGEVALRNIRRDAIKAYDKLEKEKKLSEDNVKDLSSDLQKLTDEYMKKLETVSKQKEKEVLTV